MKVLKAWVPIVFAVLVLFTWLAYEPSGPMCPGDFKTFEESAEAFDEWLVAYLEAHNDASMSDVSVARKQFYIDNNCTEALERFERGEK